MIQFFDKRTKNEMTRMLKENVSLTAYWKNFSGSKDLHKTFFPFTFNFLLLNNASNFKKITLVETLQLKNI